MAQQLVAFTFPILKGKYNQWEQFIQKLNTEYKNEYINSRKNAGIRERTFVQHTPDQDYVIVTLEGENPVASFQKLFTNQDSFTKWFVQQVKETHGFDLTKPLPGPAPELLVDSSNPNLQR